MYRDPKFNKSPPLPLFLISVDSEFVVGFYRVQQPEVQKSKHWANIKQ